MPVYITPYYNSEGPEINVGTHSKDLAAATAESIIDLSAKMKADWETLSVATMYVMSIRLYDLGRKNDAVYWFYSAQFRMRLLRSLLSDDSIGEIGSEGFELIHAHKAFHQLAGEYINGYGFGDLHTLEETVRLVKSENGHPPKFKTIYPDLQFIDEQSWPGKNKEVSDAIDFLLDYISNNADDIKAKRKANGIEGKY